MRQAHQACKADTSGRCIRPTHKADSSGRPARLAYSVTYRADIKAALVPDLCVMNATDKTPTKAPRVVYICIERERESARARERERERESDIEI